MIHDFATFQREPVPAEAFQPRQGSGSRRFTLKYVVLVVALLVCLIGLSLRIKPEPLDVDEFTPGAAETAEYLKSTHDAGLEAEASDIAAADAIIANQKNAFEEAMKADSGSPVSSFGFYDSLQASPWQVPVQKGVYITAEDRKRASYRYILQAASIRDRSEAAALAQKLKKMGMPASYSLSEVGYGDVWYRVNVGPFKSTTVMNKAEDVLVSMSMMPLKRRVH
jgi:cell division protein FtsN